MAASATGMDDQGRALLSAAVAAAEARTSGEIVTILTDRSDSYADIALAWSAVAAFGALLILAIFPDFSTAWYDRMTGGWLRDWTPGVAFGVAALVAGAKFFGTWLLLSWQPLRFAMTPRWIKAARVRARALTCFKVGAERRTHGHTGILIYLSMREHRAEIIADESIARLVSPAVWGDAMAAMLTHIRAGRVAEGLAAAVEKVGDVLAQEFPRAEDDVNELPDRLIEV